MVRYLVKFVKGPGVKFVAHLDLMRSIQRAVRRAAIGVSYSKGFNPHAGISFATPLSVGTWSEGEYLDIKLDNEEDEVFLKDRMNEVLPEDIRVISVKKVDDEFPSPMAVVDAADYEITLVNIPEGVLNKGAIQEFLNRDEINVIKSGKKGERTVNIKPMIRKLDLKLNRDDEVVLNTFVDTGSRSNLNPELIVEAMKMYVPGMGNSDIRDIKKVETYMKLGGKLKPPFELLESDGL